MSTDTLPMVAMAGGHVRSVRNLPATRLLRRARQSQAQFWGNLGVTQSGGSRYESGRSIPTPVRLLIMLVTSSEADAQALLKLLRDEHMNQPAVPPKE